jgi:preprotein translocase YajC subunit
MLDLIPIVPGFTVLLDVLATAPTPAPVDGGGAAPIEGGPPPAPGLLQFIASPMFILLIGLLVFFWFSMSQQRKQKKERQSMLDAIGRGDSVKMIGGEIGKVVEVDADAETVLVKVDETNNTKIRYGREAVATVLESKGVKSDKVVKTEKLDTEPAAA